MFIYNSDSSILTTIFVDNGIIVAKTETKVVQLIQQLKTNFDLLESYANCYLGLIIKRNRVTKTLKVHQDSYIKRS